MRKSSTIARAAGAAALVILGIAIPSAEAQLPTICPLSATDFTKTVRRVAGPGPILPGDDIEYTILLCNSGGTPCFTGISDNLDNLLGDATDIDKINMPGTVGCNGTASADGGTICERGATRTGPFSPQATTQCGTACDLSGNPPPDPDNLRFAVTASAPDQLQPGQCFRWTIRARVRGSIASNRCLCNAATAPINTTGGTRDSNDPAWMSLADPMPPIAPGCDDTETCPITGECRTCVRVDAEVNLANSTKCVDSAAPCSGISKSQGSPVRYLFNIVNTGSTTATTVGIADPLDFPSSLATPCLDLATNPVIGTPVCAPGACSAYVPNINYNMPSRSILGTIDTLPPGASVSFTVDSTVDAAAAGTCDNIWTLTHGTMPMTMVTVMPANFIVRAAADLSTSSKCIEEGASCLTTTTRAPGAAVRYNLRFVNNGTLDAVSIDLTDDLRNLGPTCSVVAMPTATCMADTATCGAGTMVMVTQQPTATTPMMATVDIMRVGCIVNCVLNAVVSTGATGQCCNVARVDYNDPNGPSSFTTGQACFDASGGGTPQLMVTKTTSTPTVTPPAAVTYDIEIRNNGTGPLVGGSLVDTFTAGPCAALTCASFSFLGGSGTCPVTCTGSNPFTLSGIGLTTGQDCRYRVTTNAPSGSGTCTNSATANPAFGATPSSSVVTVGGAPGLTVTKTVAPASVGTGVDATFTITIDNTLGAAALTNCMITDDVAATGCMTLRSGLCTATPAIAGFPATGCGTTPNMVNPTVPNIPIGVMQRVTVPVTAGATETSCVNSVRVQCDGAPPLTATANRPLTISNATCDLNGATVTFPPVTPARTAPWVYSRVCPASDGRVDPAGGTGFVAQAAVMTADEFGTLTPATPGELTLYQLDCACANEIRLFKNNVGNRVVIDF